MAEPEKANLPALAGAEPLTILKRYLSDESTKEIAASYGVTRQALGQFLLKHAESDWKDAQVARALARKESAEDDLETIALELKAQLELDVDSSSIEQLKKDQRLSALSLARLRTCEARLKAAQWDLERVCRRIYGQDGPSSAQQAVQININLRGNAPMAEIVE